MLRFDNEFLVDVGLGDLHDEDATQALIHFYRVLSARVGSRLAESLAPNQLEEVEALMRAGDEDAALTWFRENVPGHSEVVRDESAGLKAEITAKSHALTDALAGRAQEGRDTVTERV